MTSFPFSPGRKPLVSCLSVSDAIESYVSSSRASVFTIHGHFLQQNESNQSARPLIGQKENRYTAGHNYSEQISTVATKIAKKELVFWEV